MIQEDSLKNILSPYIMNILPNRRKYPMYIFVGNKPLPITIILCNIFLKVICPNGSVIAPWVTTKQFIATGSRKNDFYKTTGKFGGVKVWVTLPHPWFFKMPSELI